jgi:hypothetical protein
MIMMKTPQKREELVEKIILETPPSRWVAFSIGGCGILAHALIGRHETRYRESQSIALEFAHLVVHAAGFSASHDHVSMPQVLIDAADAVIDDPEHVVLLCTTWQSLPGGVEICSVGSNSVLAFERNIIREVIAPHTVNELLRSQGQTPDPRHRMQVTHVLGSKKSKKSCRIDDVRVAFVPWRSATAIAIIEERLIADAILEHAVPEGKLSSFIEAWKPPGKRTSVLISLYKR